MPSRIERVARLVAKPSVSSASPELDQSNRGVIDELATWLDDAGFAVEVLPLPNDPNKANLIATFGKGEGGLVLSGHSDTVPCELSRWTGDPFKLREEDGKLYGLGTCDMKAFLAVAVEAIEGLDKDSLRAPLIVLATADEESSMDGARALVQMQRPKARSAIIGEPTDMRVVHAHKGALMERITVIGRSGHSSDPRLGNSALDGMTRVMTALMRYREELATRFHNDTFPLPIPTLNLGRIHGGDAPNRICGRCELDLDVRLLPGMDADQVRSELRRCAEAALVGSGLELEQETIFRGTPAHELSRQAAVLRAAEELTGVGATSVAFATEAPYLASLGHDTIVLGPGGISEAHRPDEFVRLDQLERTAKLLQAMTHRLCKDGVP